MDQSSTTNPLMVDDPRLGELFRKLQDDDNDDNNDNDTVHTKQQSVQWKKDFLERFETFLPQAGTQLAFQAYQQLQQALYRLLHLLQKVEFHLRHGNFVSFSSMSSCTTTTTVAGRYITLTEFARQIAVVSTLLDNIIPGTAEMEDEAGFNKYHVGCVLIRGGFREYASLVTCDEIFDHLQRYSALKDVADRTLWEETQIYHAKLQKLVDIMSDLGLYKAMRMMNNKKQNTAAAAAAAANNDHNKNLHDHDNVNDIEQVEEALAEVKPEDEAKSKHKQVDSGLAAKMMELESSLPVVVQGEEGADEIESTRSSSAPRSAPVASTFKNKRKKQVKKKKKNKKQQQQIKEKSRRNSCSSSSSSLDFDEPDAAAAVARRQNDPNYDPYKETERLRWKLQHYYVSDPTECFLFTSERRNKTVRDPHRQNKYLVEDESSDNASSSSDDDSSSPSNHTDASHDSFETTTAVQVVSTPTIKSPVMVPRTTTNETSKSSSNNSNNVLPGTASSNSAETTSRNSNNKSGGSGGADRSLRPNMVRGTSFDDDDDNNNGKNDAVQSPPTTTNGNEGRLKTGVVVGGADRSLRPSVVRGTSFDDDDKNNTVQSPTPSSNIEDPKSTCGGGVERSLRPDMVRGQSFEDDINIAAKQPQPSTNDGNNDDGPKESRGGADRSLRPGMVRGQSFDDIDKVQDEPANGVGANQGNLLRPVTMRGSSFGYDDDDNLSLPASRHCKSKRGGRRPATLPSQLKEAVDHIVALLDSSCTNDNSNNSNSNHDPKARGGADRSLRPGMFRGDSYDDDNNDNARPQFLEELSTINEGRKALGGADHSLRPGMVRGASFKKHEGNGSQTTLNSRPPFAGYASPNKATYPMSPKKSSSMTF